MLLCMEAKLRRMQTVYPYFSGLYTRDFGAQRCNMLFEPGSPVWPEYSVQQDFIPKTQKEFNSVPSENETRSGETPQQVAAAPRESGAAACLQGLFGEGLHRGCPVPSAQCACHCRCAAVWRAAVLPLRALALDWCLTARPHQLSAAAD